MKQFTEFQSVTLHKSTTLNQSAMAGKQKKVLLYSGTSLVTLVMFLYAGLYSWIDISVKENITTATEK
ncbi:MAG TPA: hypothetical protein DCY35_04370 [Prolixibacteraceae bacterium]|nr:hypothetical protein [Prolixibacteraceae bacterium]